LRFILPEKKLAGIDNEFVIKRFHEKALPGVQTGTDFNCGGIGLSLEEFVEIGLSAMKKYITHWICDM
jgi:predicted hydrolase (HD superfamily)